MARPDVILNEAARHWLRAGFYELAQLLAVTLGPTQGAVLIESSNKPAPELLTDAATIARRIVSLADQRRDVGAMLLRQLVWRTHQRVGDGTAVSATLAQAILKEATKMVAAGGNPMQVQRGVREAVAVARQALHNQAVMAHGVDQLTAVAQAVTGRRDLAVVLGELFDLLGADAHISIEDFMAPLIERAYLDGGRWTGKVVSPYMQTTTISKKAIQTNCRVALYKERLHDAEDVEPLLQLMLQTKEKKLLLVGTEIKGEALETLVLNHTSDESPLHITAVTLGVGGARGEADLNDLATLTGAAVLGDHVGSQLRHIRLEQLGFAGRVEAGSEHFVVAQGGGSRAKRQEEIRSLNSQIAQQTVHDETRKRLQQRLGRLSGNAAILKVGATTKAERTTLHQKAEQGVRAMAATAAGGFVLGGGIALHNCRPSVQAAIDEMTGDVRMGGTAVLHALSAPALQIMQNAGIKSSEAKLADLERHPASTVFDVLSGNYRDAHEAGILDPAPVVLAALESAASGAMLALSVETLVLHKKPEMSYEP